MSRRHFTWGAHRLGRVRSPGEPALVAPMLPTARRALRVPPSSPLGSGGRLGILPGGDPVSRSADPRVPGAREDASGGE